MRATLSYEEEINILDLAPLTFPFFESLGFSVVDTTEIPVEANCSDKKN